MAHAPDEMPQPGDQIGPYRLVSVAGRGGMGVVYRASDTLLSGRAVAVKVMAAHLSGADAYRARFLREAEIAAELSHPGVVPVHAAGEVDGRLYLAMAWIDGADLSQLGRSGALSADAAIDVVRQVARALDALHGAGIVHGDVKPSNVIVRDDGGDRHAYLVDFGMARRSSYADPRTNELVGGTPAYAAPELQHAPPTAASDQYALACVLFELVTRAKPFGTGSPALLAARHATQERPRVSDFAPDLAYLDAPLQQAMWIDPARRFPDGAAFGQALAAAQRAAALAPTAVHRAVAADPLPLPLPLPVAAPAPRAPETGPESTQVGGPGVPRSAAAPYRAGRPRSRLLLVLGLVAAIAIAAAAAIGGLAAGHGAKPAGQSAEQAAAARASVDQLVRSYGRALDQRDPDLLAGLLAIDVVRHGSDDGPVAQCVVDRGAAAALRRWRAQLPDIASYALSDPRVRLLSPTTAAVTAQYAIAAQSPRSIRFRAEREPGGAWKLTEVVAPPCT